MERETMTKIEKLKELLLTLRLKAMAEILEETLKETQTDNLSPVDILTVLASQEIAKRQERLVKTRINQAQFPVIKTLDAFDFSFPKSINKSLILNLFDLHFVEEKGNVIIMGPPGTGKTHMALALGYQASLQGIKTRFTTAINLINLLSASLADNSFLKAMKSFTSPRALIIDELGYLPVDKQGAELLFQVISSRYECGSIIITTNRAFRDWGKILNNDNTLASAAIDRLVHHGTLVQIKGDSYRVK
jgi:DNA replication protein DnaC